MGSTLSNGYKLPADGDTGATFWDDLESNITRVNGHTHDGSNSELLSTASVTASTQNIDGKDTDPTGWSESPAGSGIWKKTITLSGLDFDKIMVNFKDQATGDILLLQVEKESTTTYTVYINDTSLDLTAVYT